MRTHLALTLTIALAAPSALAQTAAPEGDVTAAAAAFQEGQRAQLAGNQSRAAEFFELADRTAPSPAALRSAIRARQAAGHTDRAATLALRARDRDAADAQSAQLSAAVLAELSPQLARVHLACAPACTVAIDHLAVGDGSGASHTFFVTPGARDVEARWGERGARTESFNGLAGQTAELSLEAPPPPPPPPPTLVAPPIETHQPPPQPRSHRPLPPYVFWIGLGATAVSGAALLWSGLDTLSARDTYVQRPTEAGYNDGVSRQARTDILIGTTAVLGVATAVAGVLLTDWGSDRPVSTAGRTTPLFGVGSGGATVGVLRSF